MLPTLIIFIDDAVKSHCYKVVFIRHGESEFNQENKIVGWLDSDLSSRGECEARQAGQMIKQRSIGFDTAYTSVLKRAIKTCHIVLEELDLLWIPVLKSWRLNDRMYGALQGLTQNEIATKYGQCQLQLWMKSYDIPPPALLSTDPLLPEFDPRYAVSSALTQRMITKSYQLLDHNVLPKTECFKDTVKRVLPYWNDEVVPAMKKGKRVLIVAHANSIRALLKHINYIPDRKVPDVEIPFGIPLVYELNADLMPIRHYYLADDSKGCNKSKLALQHGDDQVHVWRREYSGAPPSLSRDAKQHPIFESKYALLDKTIVPDTECLRDAYERLLPFWNDDIVPAIKEGNRVLVVAHGSTLRALMKLLDHISDENIVDINIPPCIPLVYEFDEHMKPIRHYYLKDDETVASAIRLAINETKLDPQPCI
ncbi:unnamed protein product [Taenia asiatica]|uniref:phosphoglycerate mutase (2,3-diphosphoglycerate-dependent) n=1 Tax=Taenia asiatica TaxID=60517 RepID=A0A3P6PF64_TAEAS|nr:unnamed protein product [Taenia asiatica]